ncbi:unnamed protein product [Rhizoctonia solani]|uniref:DUF7330 domain-containing protein n=1 Tax=Rhizoctonia solani TaxID=456999 RepID=A0A8H3E225_9AGAM|nr:unnamed protein product [Rhizoctonia solani]CAE7158465.1 unnamed protein product [Rhizoctonia solani]
MIVPDSQNLKSEASAHSEASFGPADAPPSPPPYSATIATGNNGSQPLHSAGLRPGSSVRPNLPPRCNYFIDRKVFSGLGGTWHVDNALEIPEHLLLPINNFDGYWNREAQRTRRTRAAEQRKRQAQPSDSKGNSPPPFVETRPNLMLATSNGAISGDIHVISSDGLIRQTTLVAQGFNGSINLKIHTPLDQPLRVFASTTNGSISLKIPSSFKGPVLMSTTWGSVDVSEAVKDKLTTFSSESNTLRGFIGDWQAQGFGVTSISTNLGDNSSSPGESDPFVTWTGPFIEISSTNGSVALSHTEEGVFSAYLAQFTKAVQGFKDSWLGGAGSGPSPASPAAPPPRSKDSNS